MVSGSESVVTQNSLLLEEKITSPEVKEYFESLGLVARMHFFSVV